MAPLNRHLDLAALKSDPGNYRFMIDEFKKRREIVYNLMKEIPGFKVNYPEAGAYIMYIERMYRRL